MTVLVVCALAAPALATWSTSGAGSGRSAATTVNAGNAPAPSAAGNTVSLTWVASTLSNGAAVSGYLIKRYDSAGTVAQVVGSGTCATLVLGTSCSETSVPSGSWTYSVTPVRGNWLGAQSTKTSVTVLGTPPPPNPTITSGPATFTTSPTATFEFSDTQPLVTFQCQLDGAGFTTCSSPTVYSGLAQGGHSFFVRALDVLGSPSGAVSYSWTVDSVAPLVDVTFPVAGTAYNTAGFNAGCGTVSTGDLCGTASDPGSGVSTVKISLRQGTGNYWTGSAFSSATEVLLSATGTASWSYTFAAAGFPANGGYTIRAVATDAAGSTSPASSTFTVDTVAPPAPAITAFPPNPTGLTTASFSFTDTESGVTFQCQLDGAGFSTCTSPAAYGGLVGGSHTFQVRALDTAGNQSTATSYTWTVTGYTRYLSTSGAGNVASSAVLPMSTAVPTVTTLPNYDTNRDASPGLLLLQGGSGTSTDLTKSQSWSEAQPTARTLSGTAQLTFWSAMVNFGVNNRGSVRGFLFDCASGGTGCTQFASVTLTVTNWSGGSSTWVSQVLNFGTVNRTIEAGRELRVRLVVANKSVDNMWFAYDTTAYPTKLVIQ